MSGDVSSKKRLIPITEANIKKRNRHIYISDHHDFFRKNVPSFSVDEFLICDTKA
jgi:hypothetical protein